MLANYNNSRIITVVIIIIALIILLGLYLVTYKSGYNKGLDTQQNVLNKYSDTDLNNTQELNNNGGPTNNNPRNGTNTNEPTEIDGYNIQIEEEPYVD